MLSTLGRRPVYATGVFFFFFFCRFDSFVDFREDMLFVVLCVSQMSFSISPSRKTDAILLLLRSLLKSSAVELIAARSWYRGPPCVFGS